MTELADPNRLVLAQQFLTHVRTNEGAEAIKLLSPDVKYHVLGNHALAGTFVGPQAVIDHVMALSNRTSGRLDIVKVDDMLLGVQHVAILFHIHMEASGMASLSAQLILLGFDSSELIQSVTLFIDDIEAAERFYGRK